MTLDPLLRQMHLPAAGFLERLQHHALRSRAVRHPLLRAVAYGELPDPASALRVLVAEYAHYNRRFTQLLSAVCSKLSDPDQRILLLPNTLEEGGQLDADARRALIAAQIDPSDVAVPHSELFARFAEAIGLPRAELQTPQVATTAWIETLLAVCQHGSAAQAIGVLGLGTEAIVRPIYRQLLQGIERCWPALSRRDRAFFDLHVEIDDEHAGAMNAIALSMCAEPRARCDLAVGMVIALDARATFFDAMRARIRAGALEPLAAQQVVSRAQ